jgi:O-antigen/teichoic acid export membrane protein
MGIIFKQTIKGTIYTYLGALLGFINVAILMQYFLIPNEIGLINLLIALSMIFSQVAGLGFNNVTTRLFSYFRNNETKHNGFLFLAVSVALIGFILILVIFLSLKSYLINRNLEKSPLFVEYILLLIPLIFFILFFTIFDNYNKVLYNSTLGIFLKEILLRILIFITLVLYIFKFINFRWVVYLYVISYSVPALLLLIYLIREKQFSLRPDFSLLSKGLKRQIFGVAMFGLLSSIGTIAAVNIDKYMINNYLDLSYTGIYSIAFYFGTMIILPARSLIKVSSAVIADAWKNNDTDTISRIYYKSCLNQFIVALLLLLIISLNMHNIMKFLKPAYSIGITVIIVIGLSNLIDMLSGTSGMIIQTSRFYPFITYIGVLSTITLVFFQILLIPRFGINGAAWAFLITKLLGASIRFSYIFFKFKMQPYNLNFALVIGAGLIAFTTGMLFPELNNYFIDLIIRTSLITAVYFVIVVQFNISEEISSLWRRIIQFINNVL